MALNHSPKIVTNGLVFYYDQNNPKSYKGPAMQNLAAQLVSNYGSTPSTATGRSYSGGIQFMDIPQLGYSRVAVTNVQNNFTSFVPNSNDCCPSLHSYGSFAISPSTLYTYGIVYKSLSGYISSNYMYRYEYTSSGGSYVTESGILDGNKRIHLGDNWYWAWNTFTTQATTNWINYAASFYYRYSQVNDQLMIAKVLVAPGDYTQLHPRYWPEVNTTRLNTQAITDLAEQNTTTANNLTYSSNGMISFNGSSSYLDCGNLPDYQLSKSVTLEGWVKPYSTSGSGNIISKNMNGGYRFRIENGNLWAYSSGNSVITSGAPCTNNSWWHCVATFGPDGIKLYLNGNLVASTATAYTPSDVVSNPLLVGCYWPNSETFNGIIDIAKVYNRVLTANEVRQNFNALRGRYGI